MGARDSQLWACPRGEARVPGWRGRSVRGSCPASAHRPTARFFADAHRGPASHNQKTKIKQTTTAFTHLGLQTQTVGRARCSVAAGLTEGQAMAAPRAPRPLEGALGSRRRNGVWYCFHLSPGNWRGR